MVNFNQHYDDPNWVPPTNYDISKVPEEIKEMTDGVNEATFGSQTKPFMQHGMNLAGIYAGEAKKIAENTNKRQDELEAQTANNVAQMEADKNAVIANATVDSEIILSRGGFDTLNERLEDADAQIMELGTNVKSFGVIGDYDPETDTGSDDTVALKLAFNSIEDGTHLIFPKTEGNISFSEMITIENKRNFKITFMGSVFYDKGKQILLANGTDGIVPVGIKFINCHDFEIVSMTNDGRVTTGNSIDETEIHRRVPHVDFENCSLIKLYKPTTLGYVGVHVPDVQTNGAYNSLRASYYRFYQCTDIELYDPTVAQGSGRGEMFTAFQSKNIRIIRPTHYQGDAPSTFWSWGDFIQVENLLIDDPRIQSESTGSLFDVSGKNIVLSNADVDYPNGKFVDVTNEWGMDSGDTETVRVINCKSNGIVYVTAGQESHLITDIVIDSSFGVNTATSPVFMDYWGSERSIIKNTKLKNVGILNQGYYSDYNVHDFYKYVEIDNVDLVFDSNTKQATVIETHGLTVFKNSNVIGINAPASTSGVEFRDRWAFAHDVTDLSQSQSRVVVENVYFKDCIVNLNANVTFKDCTFDNVRIYSEGSSYLTETTNWERCQFLFKTDDPITVNAKAYFTFLSDTPCHLKFKDCEMNGVLLNRDTSTLFAYLTQNNSTIEIEGGKFNVQRITNLGDAPANAVYFLAVQDGAYNLKIKNTEFNNATVLNIAPSGVYNASEINVNISGTIFTDVGFAVHTSDISQTLGKLNLILTNNQIPEVPLTKLRTKESEFKKFIDIGNAPI